MKTLLLAIVLLSTINLRGQELTVPFTTEVSQMILVPVKLNNEPVSQPFIFDSGATLVTISEKMFNSLCEKGRIKPEEDVIGMSTCTLADGSQVNSKKIILRSLIIGEIELKNVEASVISNGSLLIGQSALMPYFQKITIDHSRNLLVLTKKANEMAEKPSYAFKEIRLVPCFESSLRKIDRVNETIKNSNLNILKVSQEENVAPLPALSRLAPGDMVIRFFSRDEFVHAQTIKESLSGHFEQSIVLQDMSPYYDQPINGYVEIWIR